MCTKGHVVGQTPNAGEVWFGSDSAVADGSITTAYQFEADTKTAL
jgi:hypothetical protein